MMCASNPNRTVAILSDALCTERFRSFTVMSANTVTPFMNSFSEHVAQRGRALAIGFAEAFPSALPKILDGRIWRVQTRQDSL